MIQESGKYFYREPHPCGGLDICSIYMLQSIVLSLTMKRIPIIAKPLLSHSHRLDKLTKKVSCDWAWYFNLSKTQIFKIGSDGTIKKSPDTLQYVYEQDFDFSLYSKDQIRSIGGTQIYDAANAEYPLICMPNFFNISNQKKHSDFVKDKGCSPTFKPSFLISIPPSKIVNDLTDVVLNYFGTTLKDMNLLSNIVYDLPGIRHSNAELYPKSLNYYACMHVRYGHNATQVSSFLDKSKNLNKSIERVINVMYERNNKNMPIYIMSNIISDNYFDFLKTKYNVYRYTDFKELKEQIQDKKEIDHNLLYSVECNIMKHAMVRVFPAYRNHFSFEYPWSEEYPWLDIRSDVERFYYHVATQR